MSSSLLIKSLIGLTGSGAFIGGGVALYSFGAFNKNQNLSEGNINPTAILVVSGGSSSGSGTVSNNGYKCQIENSDSTKVIDCSISLLNVSAKNQLYLDEIKNVSSSTNTKVDKTSLTTSTNTFKIEVTDTFIDNWKTDLTKKIKVLDKNSVSTEIATLTPLFGIKSSSGALVGKAQYFLGKANTFTQATSGGASGPVSQGSNVFKCHVGDNHDNSSAKPCELFEYADSESSLSSSTSDKDLTYNHDSSVATTITQYKHYLLKYTSAGNTDHIDLSSVWASSKKLFLHIQKSAEDTAEVDSGTKQIEFTAHAPVFFTSDTNKKALILKNKPAN